MKRRVDAKPCWFSPRPAASHAEQHFAFSELVQKSHALDQPQRMIEWNGKHSEAKVAVSRNERGDVGRELHWIAMPWSSEVVVREPHVVTQLRQPDRFRDGDVDNSAVIIGI